jgi:predicted permease
MLSVTDFFDHLWQDLRFGAHMVWSKPGFMAASVLSLALGIGATTAIFSVVYAVLIDPYPYRDADRIGSVVLATKKDPDWNTNYTAAQYQELKTRVRSMENVVALERSDAVMTGTSMPRAVVRAYCSANFFDFFGVPTLFGRAFTARDQRQDARTEPVAVLSYKFWQSAFQGRRDILGQKIRINNEIYTITGILPIRFAWMDVDAYVPMDARPSADHYFRVVYRIRRGVSQDQVNAEFRPIFQEFSRQVPGYLYPEGDFKARFVNVNDNAVGQFGNNLLVLFGAVTLLLLIACGNVANLMLARAATREGEMAVRVSMGATRTGLVRQLLTESVLLALTGGLFGVALAYVGVRAVIQLMPEYSTPHEAVIALNWPVLCFALAASLLTGFIFGLVPALQASGKTQGETLRGSGRGISVGARRRRLHDLLMVVEIALSLLLLTGAGAAIRGLVAMQNQNLGYNPKHALTFLMPLSEGRYTQWASRLALFQNVVAKLRHNPQVTAAAISASFAPPYSGSQARAIFDDRPATQAQDICVTMVEDGYLAAVGTHLLRGRDLNESDILQARPVAVITEDMVKRDFPGGKDPIGHHIAVDVFNQALPAEMLKSPHFTNSFEIVGVAAAARNRGMYDPTIPAILIPYSLLLPTEAYVIARTSGDPNSLIGAGREAVRAVDPNQPITLIRTLEEWLHTATSYQSFSTFLFSVFGSVGMLLGATGVFSVVSYSVEHRTREFGIRMALGAQPEDVLRLVLLSTGRVVAVGLVIGIALSVLASRTLANQMEGMGTADPMVFALVPCVLVLAAMAAAFFPARSATRVAPVEALRHD